MKKAINGFNVLLPTGFNMLSQRHGAFSKFDTLVYPTGIRHLEPDRVPLLWAPGTFRALEFSFVGVHADAVRIFSFLLSCGTKGKDCMSACLRQFLRNVVIVKSSRARLVSLFSCCISSNNSELRKITAELTWFIVDNRSHALMSLDICNVNAMLACSWGAAQGPIKWQHAGSCAAWWSSNKASRATKTVPNILHQKTSLQNSEVTCRELEKLCLCGARWMFESKNGSWVSFQTFPETLDGFCKLFFRLFTSACLTPCDAALCGAKPSCSKDSSGHPFWNMQTQSFLWFAPPPNIKPAQPAQPAPSIRWRTPHFSGFHFAFPCGIEPWCNTKASEVEVVFSWVCPCVHLGWLAGDRCSTSGWLPTWDRAKPCRETSGERLAIRKGA